VFEPSYIIAAFIGIAGGGVAARTYPVPRKDAATIIKTMNIPKYLNLMCMPFLQSSIFNCASFKDKIPPYWDIYIVPYLIPKT
jgi:hypothetical protein